MANEVEKTAINEVLRTVTLINLIKGLKKSLNYNVNKI